jgi:hypothetical protein
MNPRLVEPGFAVVCLHAGVPARPGKDENGNDDPQAGRQHGKGEDTRTGGRGASEDGAGSPRRCAPVQDWPRLTRKVGLQPSSRCALSLDTVPSLSAML